MALDLDLTYVNAALTRAGEDTISSFDDGTVPASVAAQNYEVMVRNEIGAHPWKWATNTWELNQLSDSAPDPWLYAYELPIDILKIRVVSVLGIVTPYAVMFDKIMTDADGSDPVIMLGIWRPPERVWPAWWAEPFTQRLHALFLRAIGERYSEASERDREADEKFARARRIDSQSQSPVDPWVYKLRAARNA